MNKQIFSLLFTAALMVSCASLDASASGLRDANASSFSTASTNAANIPSIEGHEWKLIEVYVNGQDTLFRRNTLPAEAGNFFTVNFDGEIVSGTGAPNRYSAPYTLGDNQAVSIKLIRSTMMATFLEPEKLKEHEFFIYMQNAYELKLANERLDLLSKTQDGGAVRLVFSR
jgi:heat shock protein HslJ